MIDNCYIVKMLAPALFTDLDTPWPLPARTLQKHCLLHIYTKSAGKLARWIPVFSYLPQRDCSAPRCWPDGLLSRCHSLTNLPTSRADSGPYSQTAVPGRGRSIFRKVLYNYFLIAQLLTGTTTLALNDGNNLIMTRKTIIHKGPPVLNVFFHEWHNPWVGRNMHNRKSHFLLIFN